jgi:hypothetical protein
VTTLPANPTATICGKITTPDGPGVPNVTVFEDLGNNGNPGEEKDWTVTDASGNFSLTSFASIQADYPIRCIPPAGFVHVSPAPPNTGQHVSCALGATAVANFVIGPAPVVTPAGFTLGFNAPEQSVAAINAAAPLIKAFSGIIARFFSWLPLTAANVPSFMIPVNQYAAQGLPSCLQLNFQQQGGKVGDLDVWTAMCDAFPKAPYPGCSIEIGNELDATYAPYYFIDTAANYAAAFKIASPILRARGWRVIVGNVVSWGAGSAGQMLYEAFQALGVFAVADGAAIHAYMGNAAQAIATHTACKAWLAAIGVAYYCTEFGLHGGNDWAAQITLLMAWAKMQVGMFIYFCLQQLNPATHASPEAPFDLNWNQTPFFAAMEAGLA